MEETDIKRIGSTWELCKTFNFTGIHYSHKASIPVSKLKIYSKGKNYVAKIGIYMFFFSLLKIEPRI